MIFGRIINEVDYTIKNTNPPKEKPENDYTLNAGDGGVDNTDDQPEETPEEEPTDDTTTDDGGDDYTLDDEEPPTNNEDNRDEPTDDTTDDGGDDYTMDGDTPPEDGGDTDTTGDETMDDNISDPNTNPLVEKEKNLFKLSDKEMEIKNKELKSNFKKLYDVIDDVKTKLQRIKPEPKVQNVIEFINKKLSETQDEVEHYMYYTYETRSYIQNIKQYEFYLLILKDIEKLFQEIAPKKQ